MKLIPAVLLAATTALAAPKIEEKIVGPSFVPGVVYTLSPKGMHVATVHGKDGKTLVTVDGVDGPLMDSIFEGAAFGIVVKISEDGYYNRVPQKWTGPVAFSPNGERHAYAGQIGQEAVVFLDGKEIYRGPLAKSGASVENLQFSPDSKHLFFLVRTADSHQSYQLMLDGKPVTPAFEGAAMPFFSKAGSRWGLLAGKLKTPNQKILIIDGKDAGYVGEQVEFTPDGKRVVCLSRQWQKGLVLVDGKEMVSGYAAHKFVISPTGDIGAIVSPGADGRKKLFLNGKPVVDDAADVVFSPDGKRWAAVCALNQKAWVILNDGTRHKEYWPIENVTFTPDSSKLVYVASSGETNYVVTDGKENAGYRLIHYRPVFSQTGNSFFYTAGFMMGKLSVHYNDHIDPECLQISNTALSPDGKRWVYYSKRVDNTVRLVENGKDTGPSAMNQGGPVLFSADSKHYVAPLLHAYWCDDRRIVSAAAPQGFTPDSQHLILQGRDTEPGGAQLKTWFVNGDLVAKFAARNATWAGIGFPRVWEQQPDGTIVFIGPATGLPPYGLGPMKRITVTPDSARNYVAWLNDQGAPVAAAPAATAPVAAKQSTPAPSPAPTAPPTKPAPAAVAPAAPATPAPELTWAILARRPELLPAACKVNREFRFQGGATIRPGTTVNVLELKGNQLVVGTTDGRTNFAVKPEETDALEVARAGWAQLTPAQRDLTYPALLQRTDLWPYRVKLNVPINLEGQKLRPGDSVSLLKTEGPQLLVGLETSGVMFNVEPQHTDLMAQARGFLADERGATGRLMEEFRAKLVSPIDGHAVPLDPDARPKYVVLYRGAGWCGPCQQFSPKLVTALKEKAMKPADAVLLYVSADNSPAEAKAYVTKIGIDWPTIYFKNRGQLPAFAALFGETIPQLVVTDRHGKVLVDSAKTGTDRALAQLRELP